MIMRHCRQKCFLSAFLAYRKVPDRPHIARAPHPPAPLAGPALNPEAQRLLFQLQIWLRFHDREDMDKTFRALKDDLANYKLLVATNFVSVSYLKDVETRIMTHLEKTQGSGHRDPDG